MDFFEYRKTWWERAVERNLEIIGEAINRILKTHSTLQNYWCNRNRWIEKPGYHAYDNISDETIWAILTNHLPKLKIEVDKLLKGN
jgi:uncharacterized protein with HEPN domain